MDILDNILSSFKNTIKKGVRNWNLFWFSPVDTISISGFRLCFATALFVHYIIRFFDVKLFFFKDGLLTPVEALYLGRAGYKTLDLVIRSDTLLMGLYIALCITTLFLLLGLGGRRLSFFYLFASHNFFKTKPLYCDLCGSYCHILSALFKSHQPWQTAGHFAIHKRQGKSMGSSQAAKQFLD